MKIEDFLDQEVITLDAELKMETDGMSYIEKNDFLEYESLRIEQAKNLFYQIQRTSSLISLYSILENSLTNLCQTTSKDVDSQILLTDLVNNNLIERAKIYLIKVLKLNFPIQSYAWKEIEKIQQIRNSLVHNNGVVKSGNTKLISYINQSSYVELDKYSIFLKRGFSEYTCNIIEDFFYDFFKINKT